MGYWILVDVDVVDIHDHISNFSICQNRWLTILSIVLLYITIGLIKHIAVLDLILQSEILGHKLDDNGVLVKSDADKPGYYAVGFKSEKSDHTYRYVWLYKVRAKPITENFGTKEGSTINRQTQEVEWTAVKRIHDGRYQAVADEGENGFTAEKGKEFLKSVYTPSFTAATPNP